MRIFLILLLSVWMLQAEAVRLAGGTARITFTQSKTVPAQINFKRSAPEEEAFINAFKNSYNLGEQTTFNLAKKESDALGFIHKRLDQYYKGIRIADVQYILHIRDGRVEKANGLAVSDLNVDVTPRLTEKEALAKALQAINADTYMWELKANEKFVKKLRQDPKATYEPKGELLLTSGTQPRLAENYHLVYRFDVYAAQPYSRNWVDVDAHTGEIVNIISRIETGDVNGVGNTPYYGSKDIVVSDGVFPSVKSAYWHLDTFNAHGGTDSSWWCADPALGTNGGYGNTWYKILDSDPVTLTGNTITLTFYQRYKMETPGGEPDGYDGWDGANVRISTDDGQTWTVLTNPTPAYGAGSLYSFGYEHGEGEGIPGWVGENTNWHQTTFDLSAYAGQTVRIRFAFASDPATSTADGNSDWFGWQVDDIIISNATDTLFANTGQNATMTPRNYEVFIAGNYRLREAGRAGVFTFDMKNGTSYSLATDFVDEDSVFTTSNAEAGVSAHFGIEKTYDYYLTKHNRNSFDNKGSSLVSYVHYDDSYFNAFWNGEFMTYGDGTGNATPLTTVDICGHELTHGVTGTSANLIYQYESGALNESFSDVFGTAIEFYTLGSDANWLIGEDVGTFRSMSNPAQFGDPDTYKGTGWVTGSSDNGGVHTNSGVQNKWFYLLSEGGSGTDDNGRAYTVNGIGIDKAAQIAYRNLTVYLQPSSQYADARLGSINAAIDLYGENSAEFHSVVDAWNAVGVYYPSLTASMYVDADSLLFLAETNVSSDTAMVSVINYGLDTLTVTDIRLAANKFSILNMPELPQKLSYQNSINLQVVFTPDTEGSVLDSIYIIGSDTTNSPEKVVLKGRGFVVNLPKNGTLYAVTANSTLFSVSDDGLGTSIGNSGTFDQYYGLAINPDNGELVSLYPSGSSSKLVRINTFDGEGHGSVDLDFVLVRSFDFDPVSGDIYAISYTNGRLYRADATNGESQTIGSTGVRRSQGMAIHPTSGKLYAVDNGGNLYSVDKSNASATLIVTLDRSDIRDLAFDAEGRLLALAGSDGSDVVRIHIGSGETELIGNTGQTDGVGLAVSGATTVSVENPSVAAPLHYELNQNSPNPFNPSTVIRYSLEKSGFVRLTVFDITGKKIVSLVNENQKAGVYQVTFNAEKLANGIYYYRLESGTFSRTLKMLLIK
ncbi:MAG: T9SS C-terminal target domain-containing protein [Calditrichaeota bacterium]|nr:MAG: T9SS C-terminal target domain-containing protein [Calditrichota bacterium]